MVIPDKTDLTQVNCLPRGKGCFPSIKVLTHIKLSLAPKTRLHRDYILNVKGPSPTKQPTSKAKFCNRAKLKQISSLFFFFVFNLVQLEQILAKYITAGSHANFWKQSYTP